MNVARLLATIVLGQNAHHLVDSAIENDEELVENVEMKGGCDDFALTEPLFSVRREQTITEPWSKEVIVLGLVLCCLRQQHGFNVSGPGHVEGDKVEDPHSQHVEAVVKVKTDEKLENFWKIN
jgi:hypothetical protein